MNDSSILASTDDDATGRRRTERILTAAERLFLAYGMRRTSMDDIAREAGMAKGTIYLSFSSKEALFEALAQRIVDQFLERAREAAAEPHDLTSKLVAYLDETVGAPGRLLASTGHAGEILDAKHNFAAEVIVDFYQQVLSDLAVMTAGDAQMPAMVIEAAHGCKETGPMASPDYRERLSRHIEVLLRGSMG